MLRKDKYDFFYDPVSTTVAPDYYHIIKNPMCFSTIKNKLNNGQYNNLKQFQVNSLILNDLSDFTKGWCRVNMF